MDLNDYAVIQLVGGGFNYVYRPTGDVLLRTERVSLETLLRVANRHHHENRSL